MPKPPGNPHWRKGVSGNPRGRAKGSRNKRSLIIEELFRDGSALAAAIKAKALEGDASCMSLWLSRLEPIARTRGETVEFEFDASKPLAEQLQQIVSAVAAGDLTLEQGEQLAKLAERLATVRALENGGTDKETALIEAFKAMAQKMPA